MTDRDYKISEWYLEKPKRIFKCKVCGLIFAKQNRDLIYYVNKYVEMVDEEYVKEERGRRLASLKILEKIEKVKGRGRLLDVGCANGFFLDEARRRGWEVWGVEMSKWAAEYAKEKFDLRVVRGSIEEYGFQDNFFDCVVMLDVLEHLPDPKHVLLEVRRILKNHGVLYVSTPNISSLMSMILRAKWWGINKYHLFYFSKCTFEKMLDTCGFKIERYSSHTRIFTLDYWLGRLKGQNGLLYKVFTFISKIGNLGSRLVVVNFHDQIEAAAVKTRKLEYLIGGMTNKKKGNE